MDPTLIEISILEEKIAKYIGDGLYMRHCILFSHIYCASLKPRRF